LAGYTLAALMVAGTIQETLLGGLPNYFQTANAVPNYQGMKNLGSDQIGNGTVSSSSSLIQCDPSLWDHVYHPARLQKQLDCITATGTVQYVRPEKDGDYHLLVKLDSQFLNLTNSINDEKMHGDLVVEPVCQNLPVTQPDAIDACANYNGPNFNIPDVGSRVQVTGSFVLDMDHGGWAEIHPVTNMTFLSSPSSSARLPLPFVSVISSQPPIIPPPELSLEK
jgi:hypothetical protein